MYVKNGTSVLKKVLMSKPSHLQAAEQLNEIAKKWNMKKINEELVEDEFNQLQAVYQEVGVEVSVVSATEALPHAVFARDFGGCVQEGYVMGNFKHQIRQEETLFYKESMDQLDIPLLGEVTGDGYFEGGDFAFLDEKTIALGLLDRTNQAGFQQVKNILAPYGYEVHPVPANPDYLHLDMCFNLVTPNLAVGYKKGLSKDFTDLLKKKDIQLIEGEEQAIFLHGYNVQALGENRVLSLASNHSLNQKMRNNGVEVIEVNLSETLKLGGGIHCMTFPLLRG